MYRFATNPLQWYADDKGGIDAALAPARRDLFQRGSDAGFTAISTSTSAGADIEAYTEDLRLAGLTPAPGYFAFDLATTEVESLFDVLDNYAAAHKALGVTEVYLAGKNVPIRIARPAAGIEADPERDALIAKNVTVVAQRFLDAGIRACFHQHIGTWVETEAEIQHLLDNTPADVLFLGPDTGHLTWAGIDPVAFVTANRDRVLTLHMKDIHADLLASSSGSYGEVVMHGILTEPGRGQIDNEGVLNALPVGFSGWVVMEVDSPDGITPEESARLTAEWSAAQLQR